MTVPADSQFSVGPSFALAPAPYYTAASIAAANAANLSSKTRSH